MEMNKVSRELPRVTLIDMALFLLALHLFMTNSKLLYHLNPDAIKEVYFSFLDIKEANILAMMGAMGYSLITVILIKKIYFRFRKFIFIILPYVLVGLYDGLGVTIYYNQEIAGPVFTLWGAFYYGAYTFFIIVGFGLEKHFRLKGQDEKTGFKNRIKQLGENLGQEKAAFIKLQTAFEQLQSETKKLKADFRQEKTESLNYQMNHFKWLKQKAKLRKTDPEAENLAKGYEKKIKELERLIF
jgi:hypothetical protein